MKYSPARRNRTHAPCNYCGRNVCRRYPEPYRGPARARHQCPHGQWCPAGEKTGPAGIYKPENCPECQAEIHQVRPKKS